MSALTPEELGQLAVEAARYAISRKTYIAKTSADLVVKHCASIPDTDLVCLHNDIRQALPLSNGDHDYWLAAIEVIRVEMCQRGLSV